MLANQVRDLEKRAGKGNSDAQYQLGILYYIGIGVSQDFAKAFHWFKKAAAKGDPDAQYSLGELYEQGKGVAPDLDKALEWYQKACEAGDEEACEAYARLNR